MNTFIDTFMGDMLIILFIIVIAYFGLQKRER